MKLFRYSIIIIFLLFASKLTSAQNKVTDLSINGNWFICDSHTTDSLIFHRDSCYNNANKASLQGSLNWIFKPNNVFESVITGTVLQSSNIAKWYVFNDTLVIKNTWSSYFDKYKILTLNDSCLKVVIVNDLESNVLTILRAFSYGNSTTINSMIHKDYGLQILFRRGVINKYEKIDSFDFKKPFPEYLPYNQSVDTYKIKFEVLPLFNCDTQKWNKKGLYCDTLNTHHQLSKIASNLNKFCNDSISQNIINKFIEFENASYRIALIDRHGNDLIFHLTFIENKWYITVLDRLTSDCSS